MRDPGRTAVYLLVVAFSLEAAVFVAFGRTLMDEGIFLTASRLLYAGELPYRDFPFSQGPTLLYVYGAAIALFGASILTGRLVSFAACLIAIGSTTAIARRVGGWLAAGVAILLSMVNLPALWVATTVRTQSLSTPLVLLGVLALTRNPSTALGWATAPSLLLWSSGVRLTNLLAFALVSLWVVASLRRSPSTMLRVAAIVAAQVPLVFAPFLMNLRAALDHVFVMQLTRDDRLRDTGRSLAAIAADHLRAYFGWHGDFFPMSLLWIAVAVGLVWMAFRGWRPAWKLPLRDPPTVQLALLALALLLYLPHLPLEQPFVEYFVPSSMLLLLAIALGSAGWFTSPGFVRLLAVGLVAGVFAGTLFDAATAWQLWLGSGDTSFRHFRRVARDLHELGGPSCRMVTFETQLALESGCPPIRGLEYSWFSFFPRLPTEQAEARGVLNPALLARRVREERPALILMTPQHLRVASGGGARASGAPDHEFIRLFRQFYVGHGSVTIPSGRLVSGKPEGARLNVYLHSDLAADEHAAPAQSRTQ